MEDLEALRLKFPDLDGSNEWLTSLNVSTIRGGGALNSVPSKAEATIDIRYPETEDIESLLKTIKSALKSSSLKVLLSASPVFASKSGRLYKSMQKSLNQMEIQIRPVKESGSSDARWFSTNETDIILMLPECSDFHVKDEWVSISSLARFKKLLHRFVLNYNDH